jgi:hypothetical protein
VGAIVRKARHRAHFDYDSILVRSFCDRHFHADLVGPALVAFSQTLDVQRMQCVELVFVLRLLRQLALCAANQHLAEQHVLSLARGRLVAPHRVSPVQRANAACTMPSLVLL